MLPIAVLHFIASRAKDRPVICTERRERINHDRLSECVAPRMISPLLPQKPLKLNKLDRCVARRYDDCLTKYQVDLTNQH